MADQTQTPVPIPEDTTAKGGKRVIAFVVILILVLGGIFWYWRSTFTEDTDDAQVDGNLYQISSRIAGTVTKVNVTENSQVKAGDIIAELDPKDYQVALDQAQAALASAQADYTLATVSVPITSVNTRTQVDTSGKDVVSSSSSVTQAQQQAAAAAARVEEAKANATKAAKDVERYTPLVAKDVISRQQFDAAVAASTAANAQVIEAEQNLVAQQSAITQAQQRLDNARAQATQARTNASGTVKIEEARAQAALAQIKVAQTRVDQAVLNLQYTQIKAPIAGIVSKKNVEVGANLSAGQELLTIVPLDDLWVTANFKETQLKEMKPGQEVEIEVDAVGGRKFSGRVTQIGGATGSKLSLFPPENATGNFVKVVQRIPVRIDFTKLAEENKDHVLRPGFSVTPVVRVKQ